MTLSQYIVEQSDFLNTVSYAVVFVCNGTSKICDTALAIFF